MSVFNRQYTSIFSLNYQRHR